MLYVCSFQHNYEIKAITTQHTFERLGCSIHYWLTGSQHRPLVVFTHGASIDHSEWDSIVPLVAQHYRVLTWDVRAHGLSRPTGQPFTIRAATDDLVALLDELESTQATLIGHSMGGNIGQEVVFHYPERVTSLIMLGCTCNTFKLSASEAFWLQLAGPLLRLYPEALLKRQSARVSAIKPDVQDYLYRVFCQMSKEEFIAILVATSRCLHYEPGYRITQPLLLLVGDHDTTGNIKKVAPLWAAREPHCQYRVIPQAGHVANLDNPHSFNQFVLDFLREQEGR